VYSIRGVDRPFDRGMKKRCKCRRWRQGLTLTFLVEAVVLCSGSGGLYIFVAAASNAGSALYLGTTPCAPGVVLVALSPRGCSLHVQWWACFSRACGQLPVCVGRLSMYYMQQGRGGLQCAFGWRHARWHNKLHHPHPAPPMQWVFDIQLATILACHHARQIHMGCRLTLVVSMLHHSSIACACCCSDLTSLWLPLFERSMS